MQSASFDVFNTVLTRIVGDPKAIFLLLGRQLVSQSLINTTPEAFAYARNRAESRACKNIGAKYTLDNIYTEMAVALRLTDEQQEKIMQLELELESKLICPIPTIKESIQTARERGARVIFLSDMYLSNKFIRERLVQHGFLQEGDELYLSHGYGKPKPVGNLFRKLIASEGVLLDRTAHWGDDLSIDTQRARKVQLFRESNLNRYEQILENHSRATEGLSSAMAGASRLARLQILVSSSYEKAVRDVSAGVVAPTLVSFVTWILLQAKQMGLKRLYFVSRDGQILLEIARRLIGKLGIDCELRYIYGSRLSWNLPAINSLSKKQALQMLKRASWILEAKSDLSIQDFFARVHITPEEIENSLDSVGFKKEDWEKILSTSEQQALHRLLDNSEVIDLIFQKAAQKQQILMKYLEQEGILDSTPKGLVDLGWFGSSYDSLAAIMSTRGVPLDAGLFFGLKSHSHDNQSDCKKAYFFDERMQTGFKYALPELGVVPLEIFCSADHGTVDSFIEKEGQIYPVFREDGNQRLIDWGLPMVRKAVFSFTENLLLDSTLVNPWADVREASAEVLQAFWLSPSKLEAEAWGDFPWEKGHSERTDPLAKSYCWEQVAQSFLTLRLSNNQSMWVEGSIARSTLPIGIIMKGFISFRRFLSTVKPKFIA
jgi:FMN phosphatase YigB (HAD superfamily)